MTDSSTPWPGLFACFGIAILAYAASQAPLPPFTLADGRHPIDPILIAILIGMGVRQVVTPPSWLARGIEVSAKRLLPAAIVLLGAKLDFLDIVRVSSVALLVNVTCVAVALGLTLWLCGRLQVGRKLGLLIAIGTAICGGTAIVVTAPVIEADNEDTAFAVGTVTLFGLISIVAFPLVGALVELDQHAFGVWAGVGIHATPQVMAAGFAYGEQAGEIAVVVKLVRVLLLAPMIVAVGAWYAREKRRQAQVHVRRRTPITSLLPPFVVGFLLVAAANSLQLLPDFTMHLRESFLWEAGDRRVDIGALATDVSVFLVTMSMAAVGLAVNVRGLLRVGLKALWAGLAATLILAGFSLALVLAFL